MNKYSMEDATVISGTCFRLNSLQLRTLLSGYLYAANEPSIPPVSTSTLEPSAGEPPLRSSTSNT